MDSQNRSGGQRDGAGIVVASTDVVVQAERLQRFASEIRKHQHRLGRAMRLHDMPRAQVRQRNLVVTVVKLRALMDHGLGEGNCNIDGGVAGPETVRRAIEPIAAVRPEWLGHRMPGQPKQGICRNRHLLEPMLERAGVRQSQRHCFPREPRPPMLGQAAQRGRVARRSAPGAPSCRRERHVGASRR